MSFRRGGQAHSWGVGGGAGKLGEEDADLPKKKNHFAESSYFNLRGGGVGMLSSLNFF